MNQFQKEFESIVANHITRPGIDDLLNWLDQTDFYGAPASARYHGAEPYGLVRHSIEVYHQLEGLNEYYSLNWDAESIAIVALFHDVCKANFYTVSTRNVKNEKTGAWEKQPFYKIEELYPFGGHGSKSVYLVQSFIKLTPEEAAAINSHMGAWDASDYSRPSDVYANNSLAWALHVADEAANYICKV